MLLCLRHQWQPHLWQPHDAPNPSRQAALLQYLSEEKGFSSDRVKTGLARLVKAKKKSGQKRIDSFFTFKPAPANSLKRKSKGKGKAAKKKKKTKGRRV